MVKGDVLSKLEKREILLLALGPSWLPAIAPPIDCLLVLGPPLSVACLPASPGSLACPLLQLFLSSASLMLLMLASFPLPVLYQGVLIARDHRISQKNSATSAEDIQRQKWLEVFARLVLQDYPCVSGRSKKIGGVCLSLTRSEARGKKNRDTQRRAEGFGSSKKKFGSAQMNGRAEGLSKKLGGGKDGRNRQKLVEWIK